MSHRKTLGLANITDADRAKMARLYFVDHLTQKVIASRFGVGEHYVGQVVRKANAAKPDRSLEVK